MFVWCVSNHLVEGIPVTHGYPTDILWGKTPESPCLGVFSMYADESEKPSEKGVWVSVAMSVSLTFIGFQTWHTVPKYQETWGLWRIRRKTPNRNLTVADFPYETPDRYHLPNDCRASWKCRGEFCSASVSSRPEPILRWLLWHPNLCQWRQIRRWKQG